MKKFILGLIFCALLFSTGAQENLLANNINTASHNLQKPSFPGGHKALQAHIQSNLRYPALAIEQCIEGEVRFKLHLLENGEIRSAEVLQGIGFGCDEEALRLIRNMPAWVPATTGGKPSPSSVELKVCFRLR